MKKKVVLALLIASAAISTYGQERPLHEVYSMMVFNFTKYVQWPETSQAGDFTIGVIGNEEVFKTLNAWYGGKPKGGKKYVIKKIANTADAEGCEVVFLDRSKSGEFDTVIETIRGKGTLLITDKNGLGAKGSAINFKTVENRLKFELNQKAIEASNLKVSGSLTSMAILI